MINRRKRIMFMILSGIVPLLAGGISISSAQAPAPPDFSGTWNTVTGNGKKIVITLDRVRRSEVTGSYGRNGLTGSYQPLDRPANAFVKVSATTAEPLPQTASSIRGRVTDNVLRFKWFEEGAHGAGRFTLSSDGQSFEGTFSMTDNPDDTSGGTWNGTRRPNFAGAWQGKVGESFMMLLLQQDGNRVGGQVKVNSADLGVITEGFVVGNTLRFKIMRIGKISSNGASLPPEVLGDGELVMDRAGKSFQGKVLGTATSGTLIGR